MNSNTHLFGPSSPPEDKESVQRQVSGDHLSPLKLSATVLWAVLAVASFHLAYFFPICAPMIVGFLFCLYQLCRVRSRRVSFYLGLAIGLAIYAPHLRFFWTLFGQGAVALWLVLAFWLALFLLLLRVAAAHLPPLATALLAPFLWTGAEYFRSELYYLKFSWLNVGFAFSEARFAGLANWLGVYGLGFVLMLAVALLALIRSPRWRWIGLGCLVLVCGFWRPPPKPASLSTQELPVAGIQLETAGDDEVKTALEDARRRHPETKLFVLGEFTFDSPPPPAIRDWCRSNGCYLIAGGKDPLPDGRYYNTAFVVDDKGEIVFRQAKSVPVQFFNDGLPAAQRNVWESPWGRIGIAICYDLSYRRVMDDFVKAGAQALVIPTLDEIRWGDYQHRLHARVAPMRAAEYGVPIFRVCTSGISQLVNRRGKTEATAPFPGQGEIIAGALMIGKSAGRLPLDHWLAPVCVLVTGLWLVWVLIPGRKKAKTP